MLSRLFIAALWSPAGRGLTSWLLLVMFIVFLFFPMWYPGLAADMDLSFPGLHRLSYFTMYCLASLIVSTKLLYNVLFS